MDSLRAGRWRDPTTWYIGVGMVLIAISLGLPWFTASRTARTEQRADAIAELLLQVARCPAGPGAAEDHEHLVARLVMLAHATGVHVADLEPLLPPFPGTLVCLRNKHYAFQLAAVAVPADNTADPDPAGAATAGSDSVAALEVLAWPLSAAGPGHSMYLHAEDAPRVYTRNLTSRHVGLAERRPLPGVGHRQSASTSDRPSSYRSTSDERWIVF